LLDLLRLGQVRTEWELVQEILEQARFVLENFLAELEIEWGRRVGGWKSELLRERVERQKIGQERAEVTQQGRA
jgi:hypothetical protein